MKDCEVEHTKATSEFAEVMLYLIRPMERRREPQREQHGNQSERERESMPSTQSADGSQRYNCGNVA